MLRAIMDISARTSSLPEKASTDHKRLQIKLISRLRRHELHRKVAKATMIAVEIVRKKNPIRSASPFSHGAGSSNVSSPGSGATGG